MNPAVSPTQPIAVFRKAGVSETVVLLALAWFIPFAVHLVPWIGERPLGVYLLPMFWAGFVATYFFGMGIGLVVGLFGPLLNLIAAGAPAARFAGEVSLEVVVFVLIVTWAVRRAPRLVLIAPLGYVGARLVSLGVRLATGGFPDLAAATARFADSLFNGIAGLIALAAINAGLVWFYPKPAGEKNDAAGV